MAQNQKLLNDKVVVSLTTFSYTVLLPRLTIISCMRLSLSID